MYASSLVALALALPAAPAAYDPTAMTGYVAATDVRSAFGWSAVKLAARAGALVFNQDFWTDDRYAATCGKHVVEVVHHRQYGRFELTVEAERDGYGGGVPAGFRIRGAHAGISGTSVPPGPGQDCPDRQGETIDRVRLTSTVTGWALSVTSGDVRRELRRSRSAPAPAVRTWKTWQCCHGSPAGHRSMLPSS